MLSSPMRSIKKVLNTDSTGMVTKRNNLFSVLSSTHKKDFGFAQMTPPCLSGQENGRLSSVHKFQTDIDSSLC